jgi:hypothetical protein
MSVDHQDLYHFQSMRAKDGIAAFAAIWFNYGSRTSCSANCAGIRSSRAMSFPMIASDYF